MFFYTFYDSPLGKISIAGTDKGICKLSLEDRTVSPLWERVPDLDNQHREMFPTLIQNLEKYFAGIPTEFNEALDLIDITPFQKRVYNIVRKIPYAETLSYKEVAEKIGSAKNCRACGQALKQNPVLLLIPCHRVIGSKGDLGGFSAGIGIKKKLLELEKTSLRGTKSRSNLKTGSEQAPQSMRLLR